jgi:hypothetical protein
VEEQSPVVEENKVTVNTAPVKSTALKSARKNLKKTGITFHYGNVPVWRAEIIRLPLYLGQLDFVDVKYEPYYNPDMIAAAMKDNAGHAPWITLEDGKALGQC